MQEWTELGTKLSGYFHTAFCYTLTFLGLGLLFCVFLGTCYVILVACRLFYLAVKTLDTITVVPGDSVQSPPPPPSSDPGRPVAPKK